MANKEYYIIGNSFAAPFLSDTSHTFVEADSPQEALEKYFLSYRHPCGLYSAFAYEDANAEAKGAKPLAKWLCNHAIEKARLTAGLPSYSFLGVGPGRFEINGASHVVKNPKHGRVVVEEASRAPEGPLS